VDENTSSFRPLRKNLNTGLKIITLFEISGSHGEEFEDI
jgi:hypothetical protein